MNFKSRNVFFLMILLYAFGILASAQEEKISEETFEKVRSTYKGFLAKESHRIRYTHETFASEEAKEPEKTDIWFVEFAPPDREHHFHGRNSTDPDRKYERIIIAGAIFTNRSGTWKRLEPMQGGGSFTQGSSSIEYFVRGTESLDGHKTTIYEVISGAKFAFGNGPTQSTYYRSKYWISEDGRIRKYVGNSDALMTKRNRTTQIYEYDPKIKIEAPIK